MADGDVPDYPIAYDAGKSLHAADKTAGESGFGAQWAGQGAGQALAVAGVGRGFVGGDEGGAQLRGGRAQLQQIPRMKKLKL